MNEPELTRVKSLSHNIGTPLTTILGYLSLIKKKPTDEDVVVWLDNIKTEVLKVSKYNKEIIDIVSRKHP